MIIKVISKPLKQDITHCKCHTSQLWPFRLVHIIYFYSPCAGLSHCSLCRPLLALRARGRSSTFREAFIPLAFKITTISVNVNHWKWGPSKRQSVCFNIRICDKGMDMLSVAKWMGFPRSLFTCFTLYQMKGATRVECKRMQWLLACAVQTLCCLTHALIYYDYNFLSGPQNKCTAVMWQASSTWPQTKRTAF